MEDILMVSFLQADVGGTNNILSWHKAVKVAGASLACGSPQLYNHHG